MGNLISLAEYRESKKLKFCPHFNIYGYGIGKGCRLGDDGCEKQKYLKHTECIRFWWDKDNAKEK